MKELPDSTYLSLSPRYEICPLDSEAFGKGSDQESLSKGSAWQQNAEVDSSLHSSTLSKMNYSP